MTPDKSGIWTSGASYAFGAGRAQNSKVRVLIVDDHAGYRRGLRAVLELEPDLETVGEAADGREAIECVEELKPDVVLMDMNMPGVDGLEVTRKLSHTYPNLCVIILTMFTGEEYLREARRAGAAAYVLKDAGSEILINTIRTVISGQMPIMQIDAPVGPGSTVQEAQRPEERGRLESINRLLSANERAILMHLASGANTTDIAHKMGISDDMVGTYLAEIYRKLRLPGRDAAIHLAKQLFE